MLHPNFDALDRHQEKRLTPEESVAVRNHLLWCQDCTHLLGEKQMLVRLLGKLRKDWPEVQLRAEP